jgi:hypothetical protein
LPPNVGKPKPHLLGRVFCVEPVIEDDVDLIYRYSVDPVVDVDDLRVGGIPWARDTISPPASGFWFPDLTLGTEQLGGDPLGGDVRCDVHGPVVLGIGDLIKQTAARYGLEADTPALNAMDSELTLAVGTYYRDPVNVLSYLDDAVTGCAAWWGITPTGLVTAGFIAPPADVADVPTVLDATNVLSFDLGLLLPPAWRIRVEYERHWQPEGQFFLEVDPAEKQRWSASGQMVIREDATIKIGEPRAFDVPTLRSIAITLQNGTDILNRFWDAWSVKRSIYNVSAWVDPREIELYATIAVNYMTVQKNFRITSAVRSIGGGPAQLQLWG